MPAKGSSALPEEFHNPAIIDSWLSVGMPVMSEWARQISASPQYQNFNITSDMLKRQLMDALRTRGHTIQSFRLTQQEASLIEEPATFTEWGDGACASVVSETIRTLDDLVAACKIDLTLWQVDKYEIKSYQAYRRNESKNLEFDKGKISGYALDEGKLTIVTLYAVKAWLKPRSEQPYEAALDKLLTSLAEVGRRSPISPKHARGKHLFVPALFDVHIGRRSVDGTYTVDRAAHDFDLAGDALIARTLAMGLPVDRVLLPVGNDILNADNLEGRTTHGTWQEMAADQRDTIHAAFQSYIALTEKLLELAPVDIVIVESNHDRYSTFVLGMALSAYFTHHKARKYVMIDNAKTPRKYYKYGVNLIGMEHGDKVKAADLGLIMASEVPELWGQTTYRVFFRGHFHKEHAMISPLAEVRGVTVRVFPAFCPLDQWELLMGFIGNQRRAEGLFYHRENGPAGIFPVFVDEL